MNYFLKNYQHLLFALIFMLTSYSCSQRANSVNRYLKPFQPETPLYQYLVESYDSMITHFIIPDSVGPSWTTTNISIKNSHGFDSLVYYSTYNHLSQPHRKFIWNTIYEVQEVNYSETTIEKFYLFTEGNWTAKRDTYIHKVQKDHWGNTLEIKDDNELVDKKTYIKHSKNRYEAKSLTLNCPKSVMYYFANNLLDSVITDFINYSIFYTYNINGQLTIINNRWLNTQDSILFIRNNNVITQIDLISMGKKSSFQVIITDKIVTIIDSYGKVKYVIYGAKFHSYLSCEGGNE